MREKLIKIAARAKVLAAIEAALGIAVGLGIGWFALLWTVPAIEGPVVVGAPDIDPTLVLVGWCFCWAFIAAGVRMLKIYRIFARCEEEARHGDMKLASDVLARVLAGLTVGLTAPSGSRRTGS